jgi:hypothetical protein
MKDLPALNISNREQQDLRIEETEIWSVIETESRTFAGFVASVASSQERYMLYVFSR